MVPAVPSESEAGCRVNKTCRTCGKTFYIKAAHAHLRFNCSQECMAKEYRHRLRGEANPNFRDAGRKTCERCSAEFQSYTKSRKYCSRACFNERRAAECLAKGGTPKRMREPKQLAFAIPKRLPSQRKRLVPCEVCKRAFLAGRQDRWCPECRYVDTECVICTGHVRTHRTHTPKKTCSKACDRKYRSERQKGERSHRWLGGRTTRIQVFRCSLEYQQWRESVFTRDEYTCALCRSVGGKLAAHHIKTFAEHEHLALEVWNGITLCWSCHTPLRSHEADYEDQFFALTGGLS